MRPYRKKRTKYYLLDIFSIRILCLQLMTFRLIDDEKYLRTCIYKFRKDTRNAKSDLSVKYFQSIKFALNFYQNRIKKSYQR